MSVEPTLDLLPPADPELGPDDAAQRSWPATILTSCVLSATLVAGMALPALLGGAQAVEIAALAPFLILALVTARWTFDSRGVRLRGQVSPAVVGAAIVPTVAGVGVAGGSAAVLGLAITWEGVVTSLVVTAGVLVVAAVVRAVEIRYLQASRRIFVIATQAQHGDVAREIRRNAGMALVGFMNIAAIDGSAGLRDAIVRRLEASGATMLVLSHQAVDDTEVVAAASAFNLTGGRVRDLGSFYERHFGKTPLGELTASWFLVDIGEIHRARAYGMAKRAIDVGVSAVLLVLCAPLLALLALMVAVSSRGPVLFRQNRIGKGGAVFSLLKFRTMAVAEDDVVAEWAEAHAHRVTPVGRVLRRYRLDELPQLWTILKGDMSLVGPRPEQVPLVDQLKRSIEFYDARHAVRPGLTGWAQINAGYGGSHQGTLEKLQYDFFYIRNQRLRLDLLILFATARTIISGRGL
jgi:exopolysaccharide biosynthesis polyprenyl glycosylphosphotransferase